MSENVPQVESAADRDRFISRAVDEFLNTRTGDSAMTRNVSVTAYVSAELSMNNRRPLSTDERASAEAAMGDKLRRRFGGS